VKTPFIGSILWFVCVLACLGQDKSKDTKPFLGGYVTLDGKPLANSQIVIATATTHMQDFFPDLTPIVGPHVVGVVVTPTGAYEKPDWLTSKKTDKSGYFRVTIPQNFLQPGRKFTVLIWAVPFKVGWTTAATNADVEKWKNGACLDALTEAGVQDVRYSLDAGHTAAKGECIHNGF
jgi:hypothetical protein